jgi:hypothetical protein
LRATKSSQFLNLPLARASTMASARAGPICGSVSRSVAVAVLRLILLTTGAGAVGFAGFAGVVTAGARRNYPRTFVAGRNDHRSDIACATRLREGVCTKAPEHTVNIARGKHTGFGTDRPEGRHRAADLRRQILFYFGRCTMRSSAMRINCRQLLSYVAVTHCRLGAADDHFPPARWSNILSTTSVMA